MANTQLGAFVPSTQLWQIGEEDLKGDALKELIVRLYQQINLIAVVLNVKDTGLYPLEEFVNGQQFFPNPAYDSSTPTTATQRQVYRKVINFGALPNTATTNVAHGLTITTGYTFTRIYGCTSNTAGSSYLPLPFASPTAAENIKLSVDGTNVIITTGSDRTAYTKTYVILEYLKG
jgi:hypothetical protein